MSNHPNRSAYSIGFAHGNQAGGTHNWKPGNRTVSLSEYNRGFQEGMHTYHVASLPRERELAKLNLPRSQR